MIEFEFSPKLTWNIRPFGWHEAILPFHNITQHYHLFAMPKRWAADKEGEHDDTTSPTKIKWMIEWCFTKEGFNLHVDFFSISRCIIKHVAFKCFWRQVSGSAA